MSRPFMIGVLVLLGVLLYLTSFALKKHTDPPPPPTIDEQQKQKLAQEEEQKSRTQMEQSRYRDAAAKKKLAAGSVKPGEKLPPPPKPLGGSDLPDPKTRSDASIDIRPDWFADRKQGAQGISDERRLREKNNKLAPKPQMVPPQSGGQGMPMMPPTGAPTGAPPGAPTGEHKHAPGDKSHSH